MGHTGYMKTFACAGPCNDVRSFRILTLDAKNHNSETSEDKSIAYAAQFERGNIIRDIHKASLAFSGHHCVSTGKWGCGVFKGNVYLKFLQQVIAASIGGVQELSFTTYYQQTEADNCSKLFESLTGGSISPIDLHDFLLALTPD